MSLQQYGMFTLPSGNPGSSVALSLHRNPEFDVRVLSRNSDSPKSKALKDLGITVVTANNWNRSSLLTAFDGCWAVFINIDSDNPVCQPTLHDAPNFPAKF